MCNAYQLPHTTCVMHVLTCLEVPRAGPTVCVTSFRGREKNWLFADAVFCMVTIAQSLASGRQACTYVHETNTTLSILELSIKAIITLASVTYGNVSVNCECQVLYTSDVTHE